MSRPRIGQTRADFEVTARRIRARAERMLSELPREDMNVVYARRNSLQRDIEAIRNQKAAEMTYDDNRPTRTEAERDLHETAQAKGQCTFANPCDACKRMMTR